MYKFSSTVYMKYHEIVIYIPLGPSNSYLTPIWGINSKKTPSGRFSASLQAYKGTRNWLPLGVVRAREGLEASAECSWGAGFLKEKFVYHPKHGWFF